MRCLTVSEALRVVTVLVCDGVPDVGKMQTGCLKMNRITALLERYSYWEVTIRTPLGEALFPLFRLSYFINFCLIYPPPITYCVANLN